MKVAVWDTYINRADGKKMHFDIIVPEVVKDENKVYAYGIKYLTGKGLSKFELTSKECEYCHVEAASAQMLRDIEAKGYHIVEIENCI